MLKRFVTHNSNDEKTNTSVCLCMEMDWKGEGSFQLFQFESTSIHFSIKQVTKDLVTRGIRFPSEEQRNTPFSAEQFNIERHQTVQ